MTSAPRVLQVNIPMKVLDKHHQMCANFVFVDGTQVLMPSVVPSVMPGLIVLKWRHPLQKIAKNVLVECTRIHLEA